MQIWLIFRDSSYDNSALFGLAIKWPLTFEDDFEFVHLKIDFANSGWWNRLISFRCWMVLSLFLPNNSGCSRDAPRIICHVKCGLTSLRYILWHFCQEGLGRIIWMYINYYSSAILVAFWFCLYLDFGVTFFFQTQRRVPWGFFSLSNKKHVQKIQHPTHKASVVCDRFHWEKWEHEPGSTLNWLPGAGNFSFSTLWGCKSNVFALHEEW